MKNISIYLALGLLGCNSNSKQIADYTITNGSPYEIRMNKVYTLSYRFENETEAIAGDGNLVILFKREVDVSKFAREGRIVDNGLDNRLELCDPQDECQEILTKLTGYVK